jgi:mRNA interferase HigB
MVMWLTISLSKAIRRSEVVSGLAVIWQNLAELKQTFPSADLVKKFTVFNIGGNKYRLIVYIDYECQIIFIRHILTHAEYDKDDWKNDDWYE